MHIAVLASEVREEVDEEPVPPPIGRPRRRSSVGSKYACYTIKVVQDMQVVHAHKTLCEACHWRHLAQMR